MSIRTPDLQDVSRNYWEERAPNLGKTRVKVKTGVKVEELFLLPSGFIFNTAYFQSPIEGESLPRCAGFLEHLTGLAGP